MRPKIKIEEDPHGRSLLQIERRLNKAGMVHGSVVVSIRCSLRSIARSCDMDEIASKNDFLRCFSDTDVYEEALERVEDYARDEFGALGADVEVYEVDAEHPGMLFQVSVRNGVVMVEGMVVEFLLTAYGARG